MEFLNSVFWLLVLLGVMIIVHELGHYWAALLCNVKVEQFSLGFGPRLFGFKIGETDFRFSAILFGGYVKMMGQDDMAVDPGTNPDPRSFTNKPRYQRLFIAAAGPAMNILLAIGILAGLFMYQYPKLVNADGQFLSLIPNHVNRLVCDFSDGNHLSVGFHFQGFVGITNLRSRHNTGLINKDGTSR